ncbi:MAG: hypothetical protein ABFR90_09950 [Planctomycetota bacterium]
MKKWMRVSLLCVLLIACIGASLAFGGESKGVNRVAGIWVIDKDKMQQESERLLKLARAKAKELEIESTDEQLKRLEESFRKTVERSGRFMLHFNEDGSGGVFPNIAEFKGMRGQFSGPNSLLLWKMESEKVILISYRSPFGYTKASESTFAFQGDNLVSEYENPVREIKPDETNLLLLFRLEKGYLEKVASDDPAAQKPKLLSLKTVQLESPEGFEASRIRYTTGYPEEIRDYVNQSNQKEKIKLTLTGVYELGAYNRPGGEKADHDEIIAILTEGLHDKLKKKFPDAILSTGFGKLDETKTGYLEGILTDSYKDTQTPLYTKHYILVDDGVGVLDIAITAESAEREKFMDDCVKEIKLNMNKTWIVPMEAVMEAKRKTEKYMKEKSSQ